MKKGIVFTSRGCDNFCSFCFVPEREGSLRELPIKDGWIIQDNNLLQCSEAHIRAVFDMLRRQKEAAVLKGGLEARLFQGWHRELLDTIRFSEIWFACDTDAALPELRRVADLLDGISVNKRRCYVLIGFDGENTETAEARLQEVFKLGFLPFAQYWQGEIKRSVPQAWHKLQRDWSRPAIYKSIMAS